MPFAFEEKKRKILAQLSAPEEAYSDLSPKGTVDLGVRELCAEINALDGFVTTSSCAGRIAVYLDGWQKHDDEANEAGSIATSGGKGGGQWFYVSHDPVDISGAKTEGGLLKLFGMDTASSQPSTPSKLEGTRFVHFRFEPMILHILTSTLTNAHTAHSAGLNSGFRESGISSISGPSPTPIVAIRTQGLFLSSIIGYQESPTSPIKPMVSEAHLEMLVELANKRFSANEERKQRFRRALLKLDGQGNGVSHAEWEPAEARRERKRAEGLRRREELRQSEMGSVEPRAEEGLEEQQEDGEDGEDHYAAGLDLDPDAVPP